MGGGLLKYVREVVELSEGEDEDTECHEWIDVGAADSVGDASAIEVIVKGRVLAVLRCDGELFAMDGMCAHQGGPIADGIIEHGCVTCPWHGWQYELETGIQTINRQPLQETFEVRERDGRVEVRV